MNDNNEENLDHNETIFPDMIVQMVSGWYSGDRNIINSMCESISDEISNLDGAMPGLLFGCILHITTLINKSAGEKGITLDEAWGEYVYEYNTMYRSHLSNIPLMHPSIAEKAIKEMD